MQTQLQPDSQDHTPAFARIERPSTAVDRCADAIRDKILSGELPVQSRLPPERALADQLGVNRTTARAALAQLESQGLLSVRQGSGYQVRDYTHAGGPDLLPGLARIAREDGQLGPIAADLLAMRRHLAAAVLEKLAGLAEVDTDALQGRIDEFAALVIEEADIERLAEADLAILAALLAATGSPVLQLCFNPVAAVVSELPELRRAMYLEPESNLIGWQSLCAWLGMAAPRAIAPVAQLLADRDVVTLLRMEALA